MSELVWKQLRAKDLENSREQGSLIVLKEKGLMHKPKDLLSVAFLGH